MQTYLSTLRARVKPTTAHLHFSKLRAFFRWCEEAGVLQENPLRGISVLYLRHYAATSIFRQTGDLELVRQVLRHESLAMALRYAHLTKPDVSAKFRRASPLDNLRAGR